ncbi:hypothetical protein HYN56_21005 [Flavobacterium crocinum]|uniref:Uncharacterized protein n=1 Tax=Flavobacterium crocinum TaxID=2183896 RepID=A0A2S1YR38_9FLAO|nr:hypothetical protein HYN56_21000 [Flavobacterium crocinum]AWK06571.1 hypothetical protein HYN56_21005 [Flavobacterium crocinum]
MELINLQYKLQVLSKTEIKKQRKTQLLSIRTLVSFSYSRLSRNKIGTNKFAILITSSVKN